MTEQERMLSGALYNAGDPALLEARQRAKCLCHRFNTQSPEDNAYAQHQQETLQALLGHVGTQCWIEAPFHCDYGTQITIGDHFFANYDCIFLDVAPIVIGNHVWISADCKVLKGVTVPNNCIIGTNSVVTKKFTEENCIIAGNPAGVLKREVNWIKNPTLI